MSQFKEGDSVKVAFDAVVFDPKVVHGRIIVSEQGGERKLSVDPTTCTLIEPEYEHDGIYQDALGTVWRHTKNNGDQPWQQVTADHGRSIAMYRYASHDVPKRPLRRMRPQ